MSSFKSLYEKMYTLYEREINFEKSKYKNTFVLTFVSLNDILMMMIKIKTIG